MVKKKYIKDWKDYIIYEIIKTFQKDTPIFQSAVKFFMFKCAL